MEESKDLSFENIGLKQLKEQREETIKRWEKIGLLEGLNGNVKEDCAKLFEGRLSYIVDAGETANDLWNDLKFINKRIAEQEIYLKELVERFFNESLSTDRYEALKATALFQLEKFQKQKELLDR